MRSFRVEDVGQLLLGVCFSPAALSRTEEEVIGLSRNLQLAVLGLNLTPRHVSFCLLWGWGWGIFRLLINTGKLGGFT